MRVRADVYLETAQGTRIQVGAVADDGRSIVFQYLPNYSGPSISPVLMPVSRAVYRFPDLRDLEAFHGLPGVLADSLPDRFGTRLMDAYFRETGKPLSGISPVSRLLYIGDRAMGALSFSPATQGTDTGARKLSVTLDMLRAQARRAIEGVVDDSLSEIRAAASSAGGMRAKALVSWNRATNNVAFEAESVAEGYEPWLVKFDGVGSDGSPQFWCRLEYAYACMARDAGIQTPEVALLKEGAYRHFGSKRFDRVDGRRMHMVSLCGLQHADFNEPAVTSYELAMRTVLELGMGAPAVEEQYRRMVFNVIARNQDDHTKNIAYLMDPASGEWTLSPAYDITYANGVGYTKSHQMSLNNKVDDIERSDLLDVAAAFGVRYPERIITEVADAVRNWPIYADEAGLSEEWVDTCANDHRLHLAVSKPVAGPSHG